jgi:mRNA interferase MazF
VRVQPTIITRGRTYLAPLGTYGAADNNYWLCVSNNIRNPRLDEFIAVRMTSTRKPQLSTWVSLTSQDKPWVSVACDDLGPIWKDQVIKDAGALSAAAMRKVDQALLRVLGIESPRLR